MSRHSLVCRGWGSRSGVPLREEQNGVIDQSSEILIDMVFEIAESVASAYLAEAAAGLSGNS